MGFRCGIVGLPNVGKSTLFNALTRARVEAANYPFCTIDPNVGIVGVPDPRLDRIAAIVRPQRTVPTTIEFVDIAGLVAGASKGEGLGNRFLAHIREVDAIAHVVRAFEDPNVVHVAGGVHPVSDIDTVETELILADLDTIGRAAARADKAARVGDKDAIRRHELLERVGAHLDGGLPLRAMALRDDECEALRPLCLLTGKPVVYVANVTEGGLGRNPLIDAVRRRAGADGAEVVVICAAIEQELSELDDRERQTFLAEMGLTEVGLDQLIRAGYRLLDLLTFFTAGPKEARAWTVRSGATAPQAAGAIHTDFQRGFIRAEVISYEDYVRFNGEQGARNAGRMRLEGKGYVVCDGDVMHFRFNV